jgi:YidC/Oxa1 family membrane protein insertase
MPIDQLRNMLLIALALIGFLLWQAWQEDYGPQPVPPLASVTQGSGDAPPAVPVAPSQPPADATASDVPSASSAPTGGADVPQPPAGSIATQPPTPGVPSSELITVTTDLLEVGINPQGGSVESVRLLRHAASVKQPDQPFQLMDNEPPEVFIVQTGLLGEQEAPTHQARFTAQSSRYTLGAGQDSLTVMLRWRSSQGIEVEKQYRFQRDSYVIQLKHVVRNGGAQPWSGRMYAQIQRTQVVPEGGLFRTYTYTGGVISNVEKPYEKLDFEDMASRNLDQTNEGGWLAMIQHYFVGALIPPARQQNYYYSKALPGARYALGVMGPAVNVAPGATQELGIDLFAGPKEPDRLAALAPNLERTVDYGWLWFIAEPLFYALRWIHGVVGNWGFAIIVLTIIIKALFFHLSAASYRSMARMRKLQPRITALRERYAGDKARMNQAMMEMYKEEKINPLGGCLPILVQIPVFIALYWVLLETVALRHAPFVLWLNDLSEHDPYFVLPLIMGASMFVQQRLNPAPPDPVQAKVMMALPIVFTFLFLFFPSGLVLYWIVNNLLSIAQQWVITRKIVGPDG